MQTTNWILITIYGILLLVFAIISCGQSAPQNLVEQPTNTTRANIFDTPRIAKSRCSMGRRWAEGKCRIFVD